MLFVGHPLVVVVCVWHSVLIHYYNILHKWSFVKRQCVTPSRAGARIARGSVQRDAEHVHLVRVPCYDALGGIPVIDRAVHGLRAGHVEVGGVAAIVEGDNPCLNHTIIYHTNGPLSRASGTIVVTSGPGP